MLSPRPVRYVHAYNSYNTYYFHTRILERFTGGDSEKIRVFMISNIFYRFIVSMFLTIASPPEGIPSERLARGSNFHVWNAVKLR